MEYIHLIGVEQIQSAANAMRSSADEMKRAADNFDESVRRLILAMNEHANRVEEAMRQKSQPIDAEHPTIGRFVGDNTLHAHPHGQPCNEDCKS